MIEEIQQAVYEFIATFTNIPKDNIVKGWQNTNILPQLTEHYAVFTAINETRRGTNIEENDPDNNSIIINKSNIIDYQIDIVSSDSHTARDNAAHLETIARSAYGVDFFNKYNINLLYADNAKAIQTISKTDNYINRYMITLHLEKINKVTVSQEYFDNAEINPVLANRKI